jgi:hypothetical protein
MLCCLVLIVLFGVLPPIATLVSGVIADVLGCTVNEGGIYPCLWYGHDLGETLAVLFSLGWFAFATLPVAACGLAVWLAAALSSCCGIGGSERRRRRFNDNLAMTILQWRY